MGRPPHKHRTISLHDPLYGAFVDMLIQLRKDSGLKQWHVAKALGWHQSVVSKIERRERRIDVVELVRVTEAIGADPAPLVRKLQKLMRSQSTEP